VPHHLAAQAVRAAPAEQAERPVAQAPAPEGAAVAAAVAAERPAGAVAEPLSVFRFDDQSFKPEITQCSFESSF
jgi:hypothetical protein